MENNNVSSDRVGGIGAVTPTKKATISARQVENGFIISFSSTGYSYGEKTYIATNKNDLLVVLGSVINEISK
jgi:hypothetical protein